MYTRLSFQCKGTTNEEPAWSSQELSEERAQPYYFTTLMTFEASGLIIINVGAWLVSREAGRHREGDEEVGGGCCDVRKMCEPSYHHIW
jgi:hypothetical protein